ncbi:MAG: hypothetical protein KAQ98_10235 [Bacteriovoracaceae bacterium]|nr:hypothetical protein [Bacteriovoracaceae bacterium]
MKKLLFLFILILLSERIFGIEKNGVNLGWTKIHPSVRYTYQYQELDNQIHHLDTFGSNLLLEQGKSIFKFNQAVGGTRTPKTRNPYDYYYNAGISYNALSKVYLSANGQRKINTQYLNTMWHQTTRSRTDELKFKAGYDSGSKFSINSDYQTDKEEISLKDENVIVNRKSIKLGTSYGGYRKLLFNLSNKILSSFQTQSFSKQSFTSYSGDISYGPLARLFFGLGYTYNFDNTDRKEKTPFLLLMKKFCPRSDAIIRVGKTKTNRNQDSKFFGAGFKYEVSPKTSMNALYQYGFGRDALQNVTKSHVFGAGVKWQATDRLNFAFAFSSTVLKTTLSDSTNRQETLLSTLKYYLIRYLAFELENKYTTDDQYLKFSIIGFI